mmetsp:Transcript_32290/g.68742  ORF Transcript_32290/g.68742 Transcript_32290/m.68742 type:complete len:337 (-) Transcript_32290:99-1109(-)|eukprot:CAMPEP_0180764980 /NCGR_PEP_ID=MMETSP1038_2-20121128/38737_1 /TAXON_ID=632150 /ORGANISM="Azadinium spinosum, Strain 3D9" /LENGTH=336 /DNA_ID=CAMNT_0022799433 /DNA_START=70 /DNA_END=1080 /DNA_ORIENTATION=+
MGKAARPPSRRRAVSVAGVAAKRAKVAEEWKDLAEEAHQAEQQTKMAEIIFELERNPDKIDGCLLAVKGDLFTTDSERADYFPPTYIYMTKVPQSFLKEWWSELRPSLATALKDLMKNDKALLHKLLYRAFVCEGNSRIPAHQKARFKTLMLERYHRFGGFFEKLTWSLDCKIDWSKYGIYTLEPPVPEGFDAGSGDKHLFTHIVMLNTVRVPLSGDTVSLHSEWTVKEPHSLSKAVLVSPPSVMPQLRLPCKSFFVGNEEAEAILAGVTLEVEDGVSSEDGPTTPTPQRTQRSPGLTTPSQEQTEKKKPAPPGKPKKGISASCAQHLARLRKTPS